jgi:hypothetical protein
MATWVCTSVGGMAEGIVIVVSGGNKYDEVELFNADSRSRVSNRSV